MTSIAPQNFAPDDPFGAIAEQNKGRILPQAAREWFIANGVPPVNLVKTWCGYYDMVLHDDVIFLDNGCFEFCRYREGKAQPALTFVLWSIDGSAEDVCAWQATTGRLATWLGHSCMLGEDNLSGAQPEPDGAVRVHADPLDWFKAGRAGVVVLKPEWAAPKLRDRGVLIAPSIEDAKKLRKSLAVTPPKILVPGGAA
jgi:hypothetical protein